MYTNRQEILSGLAQFIQEIDTNDRIGSRIEGQLQRLMLHTRIHDTGEVIATRVQHIINMIDTNNETGAALAERLQTIISEPNPEVAQSLGMNDLLGGRIPTPVTAPDRDWSARRTWAPGPSSPNAAHAPRPATGPTTAGSTQRPGEGEQAKTADPQPGQTDAQQRANGSQQQRDTGPRQQPPGSDTGGLNIRSTGPVRVSTDGSGTRIEGSGGTIRVTGNGRPHKGNLVISNVAPGRESGTSGRNIVSGQHVQGSLNMSNGSGFSSADSQSPQETAQERTARYAARDERYAERDARYAERDRQRAEKRTERDANRPKSGSSGSPGADKHNAARLAAAAKAYQSSAGPGNTLNIRSTPEGGQHITSTAQNPDGSVSQNVISGNRVGGKITMINNGNSLEINGDSIRVNGIVVNEHHQGNVSPPATWDASAGKSGPRSPG